MELPTEQDVVNALSTLYINCNTASLRNEDKKKAKEVHALLLEIARVIAKHSRRQPFKLIDVAAGKGYIGLLTAQLLLRKNNIDAHITLIEQEPTRTAAITAIAQSLQNNTITLTTLTGAVESDTGWSGDASLVVGLHACARASDSIIAQVVKHRAKQLLLIPCCIGESVTAELVPIADRMGIPKHGAVRHRFLQSIVHAKRTLTLESAGYYTEVVECFAAKVSPYNLLWRSRYEGESVRMARSQAQLQQLLAMAEIPLTV